MNLVTYNHPVATPLKGLRRTRLKQVSDESFSIGEMIT
jgi:hypothetical protein